MGCQKFMRVTLYVLNLIFVVVGLILLAFGIFVENKVIDIDDIFEDNLLVVPALTMVVGYILFLVAFFGCCGAIMKSNYMLVTYAIFMIMLMTLKIALFTIIYNNLASLTREHLRRDLKISFDKGNFTNVETKFKCCGTTGAAAYNGSLSDTCCASSNCTTEYAYEGCNDAVRYEFDLFASIIALLAMFGAALVLVTVMFTLCFAYSIRREGLKNKTETKALTNKTKPTPILMDQSTV